MVLAPHARLSSAPLLDMNCKEAAAAHCDYSGAFFNLWCCSVVAVDIVVAIAS